MAGEPDDRLRASRHSKRDLRARAKANRQRQSNQAELSQIICEKLIARNEFVAAKTILTYVGQTEEVHTDDVLNRAWSEGKRVVVPSCHDGELLLYRIDSWQELAPRTLGIAEPRREIRHRPDRRVEVDEVDLVVVPGVAFDRRGGRVGYGKGYYDRLLAGAPAATPLIALAFECQLVPEVPMMPHDVFMDVVITEQETYLSPRASG